MFSLPPVSLDPILIFNFELIPVSLCTI